MQNLWQDLRYGVRMIAKNPGFTLVAVMTLALGIGANSAIFSILNAFLLRPLPVAHAERVVKLYPTSISYPDFVDYRSQSQSFEGMVAHRFAEFNMAEGDRAERLFGEMVSGDFFTVLGTRAARGRMILPTDDVTGTAGESAATTGGGASAVAVISHRFWERRFGSDPSVVGRTIVLNGHPFNVVGVADRSFTSTVPLVAPDIWVPLSMHAQVSPGSRLDARDSRWLSVTGRLRPGVSLEQAEAEINALTGRLALAYPETNQNAPRIAVLPTSGVYSYRGLSFAVTIFAFLGLLFAVVGAVLLIACANVANLLLARATVRRREIAVRLALGASRGRLVRQLLTESLLLATLAGVVGLMLALWLTDLISSFRPPAPGPLVFDLSVDRRVLAFTVLLSVLTSLVFGLAPALQATKQDLVTALKDETSATGYTSRRFNLRNLLVVAQVTVSVVLLVFAGLFLRSLRNSQMVETGFETKNALVMPINLRPLGYDEARGRMFYRQLMERVAALPGVRSVGLADVVPLTFESNGNGVSIEGRDMTPQSRPVVDFNIVSAGYFETMSIPLVRGRDFGRTDTETSPGVVIVNETFARRFFPGEEALGKRIQLDGPMLEIVGVARDSKYRTLGEDPQPFFYVPFEQGYNSSMILHVATHAEPHDALAAVQRETLALDRNVAVSDARTMRDALMIAFYPSQVAATLLGALGALGLTLAAVGIFGVVNYSVAQRTREIGVRMALGAQARDIFRLVVGHGMLLVTIGAVAGLVVAFAVTRLMTSLLHGVSPTDPLTFAFVTLVLAGVALLACYLPARKATKVDPMVALRYE